ncbi:alpha/beta hydrolase [Sphingomonas colocasiae]|uniref:AB hydrolase-1 domain-containing protein n=1 Tax=Sphingomonas colocasiae TaxID=1848973 RepID=A0ABS7PQP2_9SPHN|nr:alpha/beta fold hydrolase [Sphingomonas colocasiae]MBY8823643.1 hypothetical protein [Sphingomonas colocasiae]
MWVKIFSLLAAPALIYLTILAYVFFAQTGMVFPAGNVPPSPAMPPSAERLELASGDGDRLIGTHLPPREPGAKRLVLLGFGGNGWNADAAALKLRDLYPEADIVVFHYRGYAPSTGTPGADALIADARVIHDRVRARFPGVPIVGVGFSIGSGVAVSLAAARPLDGLILVTPFDSLANVAAGHFPWLPVRPLLRHRLEPATDIRAVRAPVALVVGGNDTLIPPAHAEALRRSVPDLVLAETLPGAGHNDIYDNIGFRAVMRDALARILAR